MYTMPIAGITRNYLHLAFLLWLLRLRSFGDQLIKGLFGLGVYFLSRKLVDELLALLRSERFFI